jgi:class 3 adenylate cyclase/CHASE2 domain-containing sensor protein
VRRVVRKGRALVKRLTTRRRSVDTVVVGIVLTLLVICVDSAGLLTQIEFLLYDLRASVFQFFLPKASDKLMHLDVDEDVLRAVAASEHVSWPWPRSLLAEMFDEVRLAHPKVVGLDILFSEPQKPAWEPMFAATTRPVRDDKFVGESVKVDHDKILGESLKRLGCVLVPVSLPFKAQAKPSDLQTALREELSRDLNLSQVQLVNALWARGINDANLPIVAREYLDAWREEMAPAIAREIERAGPAADRESVKRRLLKLDESDLVLEKAFDQLYEQALSTSYMVRFSRPIPPGLPTLFSSNLEGLPVRPIAAAAAYSAFVDYAPFRDGRVRAVPLFVRHDDRMYPQLGLAMACAQLDVPLDSLQFRKNTVVLPLKDGHEIAVPYRSYRSTALGQEIATFIDIPWWGNDEWAYMYDHPNHREPVNHLSMVAVLDLVLTKRKIVANSQMSDAALIAVLAVVDKPAAEAYVAHRPPADDVEARRVIYRGAAEKMKDQVEFMRQADPKDLDQESRTFLASAESLPRFMTQFDDLEQRLHDGRDELRKSLGGKAVFVGWTATGVAADFVPTSIHAKCPGVVLHGAIFNGIMTGELWRTLPSWLTYLVTAVLGLAMTAAATFFTPARALVVAFCLGCGYILLNGLLLFDRFNLILGAAGPLLCIAAVWQGCTLIRLIVERYQRSRIEGRFRSYVDPALVDFVVQNPNQIKLEGQVREMTVCFTDLGGFTALTSKLKEATVPLLNEIFDALVPEIRNNNGYVNKFLGDGIMFFFGAPRENPYHARDALRTVLEIQRAMRDVNAALSERGLANVTLRAGVNTGSMVVGDAGSEKASDYTVLGDHVNLASRMESANKQLGTDMLVSRRTVELAGQDGVLLRSVGQIQVVGREEPVEAYEIVCRQDEATDAQRRLVELTQRLVDAYRETRLEDCLAAAAVIEGEFGPSKLTKLYTERCEYFLAQPNLQDFTCTITLAEK